MKRESLEGVADSTPKTYTAQEIRNAVDAGKHVTCGNGSYEVIKDNVGQYLIHFLGGRGDYYIGLTGLGGTQYADTLNASDFVIRD